MAFQDVAAQLVGGFANAAGNPQAAGEITDFQQRRQQEALQQRQEAIAPLTQALQAERTRLALYADPNDPTKAVAGHEAQYTAAHDAVADIIGKMRNILHPPPANDPHGLGYLGARALDKLHITRDLAGHMRDQQAQRVQGYNNQTQGMVNATVEATPPSFLTPEQQAQAARIKAGIDPRAVAPKPQARDSIQKAQWDAEARKLGYKGYDDPNMTGEDVEKIQAALRAPIRPSQAALATYLRARYGDNPTAAQIEEGTRAHQALMAGLKVGEHQQIVFDDFGNPHVVNLHSESRTEYPGAAPAAPSSTTPSKAPATPSAPKSGGTSAPKPRASSSGGGLGFTKGNPIVKSDAAQYTKVAEDANNKKEAFESARKALAGTPTASSDQELIYSWVRANVQGAGRMTQAEFRQAASIGSLPERAQIAWEKLKSGKLPPEMESMLLADIQRSYETSQAEADDLRKRLAPPQGPKTKELRNQQGGTDVDKFLKSF